MYPTSMARRFPGWGRRGSIRLQQLPEAALDPNVHHVQHAQVALLQPRPPTALTPSTHSMHRTCTSSQDKHPWTSFQALAPKH